LGRHDLENRKRTDRSWTAPADRRVRRDDHAPPASRSSACRRSRASWL